MKTSCLICNHDEFNLLLHYDSQKVVTSDNKLINQNFELLECKKCFHIQKKIDEEILQTIDRIYAEYEAYYLSNGKEEEKIDENNANMNRSQNILHNISAIIKSNGNILDIGTGSGVFLEEYAKVFNWNLFAQDVKISANNHLVELKNFKKFFLYKQEDLYHEYFDIISAIHVFEHILNLNQFLISVKNALKKDGFLLLQTPNLNENLLDIFIIDHVSHFNKTTIYNILKEHFEFVYFPQNQIHREITVIATNKEMQIKNEVFIDKKKIEKEKIIHLINFIKSLDKKIAIFGTSPPALFCATLLNFQIEYFVDENLKKIDKTLFDKKIIHPNHADKEIAILFIYDKSVLVNLETRYPLLDFIYLDNKS